MPANKLKISAKEALKKSRDRLRMNGNSLISLLAKSTYHEQEPSVHGVTMWLKQLGVALLYALLAILINFYITADDPATVFWPGSGLALAVLLIGGQGYALGIFAGALLGTVFSGSSPFWFIGAALTAVAEAWLALWLLNRRARFSMALATLPDYLRLLLWGAALPCILGAFMGILSMWLADMPHGNYFKELMHWWMGDVLGIALITPLILSWWQPARQSNRQWMEGVLLLAVTFVVGQITFLGWLQDIVGDTPRTFPVFLIMTVIASRLGARFTSLALCMIALQGLAGAYLRYGYFSRGIAEVELENYWFYMLTLAGVGMSLAAYVTDRKQTEVQLLESERYLRAIINNEPECIKIVDAAGCLTRMNQAGLNMLEADSIAPLLNRPVIEVIAEEYRAAFMAMHHQVLAGATVKMEFEVIGLKGGRRFMETHAVPMETDGQTVQLAITRDITERRRAEVKYRES